MADWLIEGSGMTADPKARAWHAQDRKYLALPLLSANPTGGGVGLFVRWVYDGHSASTTSPQLVLPWPRAGAAAVRVDMDHLRRRQRAPSCSPPTHWSTPTTGPTSCTEDVRTSPADLGVDSFCGSIAASAPVHATTGPGQL